MSPNGGMTHAEALAVLGPEVSARVAEQGTPDPPLRPEQIALLLAVLRPRPPVPGLNGRHVA